MVKNSITLALDKLSETDVWSLMLFALWRIKEIPEYATLSELVYILDTKSVIRFFDYYGGQTLKIPTKEEFKEMIDALLLYQYVNLEKKEFTDSIKELNITNVAKVKEIYTQLVKILSKYDFRRN